ncbi:MAG TPA: cyclic nucleotide-binding domain-containing protein, partial [Parvularculaceae bacterium]|nr:cyclic nucleotide-binding domain-containing protein [Parvularculaceae bacterium]
MQAAFDRCRELSFFKAFDDASLRALIERSRWFSLTGGMALFQQGDPSSAVYFVLTGRLIVVRGGEAGDEVLGYVRSGEPVGEMSLLAGEAHSASVYALRDTELLAVDKEDADYLMDESVDFAHALANSIVRRARHPNDSFKHASPRVFDLLGYQPHEVV